MSDEQDPLEMEDKKINLKDIKPLDVWTIIETYFRDNPNYKTQHQIDSFNELITSKTNGIDFIIRRENPQIIHKEEINADKGEYKYQISIYYGETLKEDGTIDEKVKDNIEIYSITKDIRNNFNKSEILEIFELMWSVMLADGKIDDFEEALMSKLVGLFHLTGRESAEAKKKAISSI